MFGRGLFHRPYLVEGIIQQILHVTDHTLLFSTFSEEIALEKLPSVFLTYVVISVLALGSTIFVIFIKKLKKNQASFSLRKSLNEKRTKRKLLNYFIFSLFLFVTLIFCFYTVNLIKHLSKSKYGAESIIRQETHLTISEEQPLFVNGEIKGISFDDGVRAISIFYLKYIGLIYLEAIFVFLFLAIIMQRKREIEDAGKNTS